MNKFFTLLGLSLAMFLVACSGTQTTKETETEEVTVTEPASSADNAMFAVVVLNDTIPSPRKELSTLIDGAAITINYGSPSVKGRALYGDLVPFDKVWRTGANEATTFETSKDLTIGGETLPAGKYGMFSVPGEGSWTLIFNETADQWGAYEYDESKDVLRVSATPAPGTMTETMEFTVTEGNTIVFHWGELTVPFSVAAAS